LRRQALVFQGRRPYFGGCSWWSGPSRALRLTGTPVIIGNRKGRMEWMISGLLKDPATLTSAIRTRVEYRAHQPELNRHGARFLPTDRAIPSARPADGGMAARSDFIPP